MSDAETELILLKQTLSEAEASVAALEGKLSTAHKELEDEKSMRADVEKDLAEASKKLEAANEQIQLSQALDDAQGGEDISGQSYEDKGLAMMAAQYMFSKAEYEILVGNYRIARPLLEECYSVRKEHMYGDAATANTCYALGEIHRKSGDLIKAKMFLTEALEAQKLLFGMFAEQSAACVHALAEVKRTMGYLREAEEMYTENMNRRVEVVGDVGSALYGVGALLFANGKYKEAQENAERSYNIRMKQHKGLKHVDVIISLILKARIQNARGEFEGGQTLAEQALANLRALTSESNPLVAEAMQVIADSLFGLGEFGRAVERYDSAGKMAVRYLGEDHQLLPAIILGRAKTMLVLGQFTDARSLLERVAAIRDALTSTECCGLVIPAQVEAGFADYHKAIGEYSKAVERYKEAIKLYNVVFETCGPPSLQYKTHPIIAGILLDCADALRLSGKYDEAHNLAEYGKDIIGETLSLEHPLYGLYAQVVGDVWLHKAMVSKDKLDFEEADKQFRRAMNIREKVLVAGHLDFSVTLNSQAESCRVQESFDEASKAYEEALEIRTQALGVDHWSLLEIQSNQALLTATLNVKECQKDEWFTSDPTAPCPIFKRQGFLDAAESLQKIILKLRNKLRTSNGGSEIQGSDWFEHPVLINIDGNFGVVKKMESLEKSNFTNKLNKTHRKLFKEAEETASSGAMNPTVVYKAIGFNGVAKETVQLAMEKLTGLGISSDHQWFKKFEKYNIDDLEADEFVLAQTIIREGDEFQYQGKYRSAEDKFEVALELLNTALGGENVVHPIVTALVLSMANNYRTQARFRESRVMHERALSMSMKLYEEGSLEVGTAYYGLGQLYLSISRLEEARANFDKAVDSWAEIKNDTPDHRCLVQLRSALVECEFLAGNYSVALKKSEDLLPVAKEVLDAVGVVEVLMIEGRTLNALGRLSEAMEKLEEAYNTAVEINGKDNPLVARVKMYQAKNSFDMCKYSLALTQIQSASSTASAFVGIRDGTLSSRNINDILSLTGDDLEDYDSILSVFSKMETYGLPPEDGGFVPDQLPETEAEAGAGADKGAEAKVDLKASEAAAAAAAASGTELAKEVAEDAGEAEEDDEDREITPADLDFVFTVDYVTDLQEVYTYGGMNTKAHPLLAEMALTKATFLMSLMSHEYKAIKTILDVVLLMQEKTFGTRSLEAGFARQALALFHFLQGNWENSLEDYTLAAEIFGNFCGMKHPNRLDALFQIAEISRVRSEYIVSLNMHSDVLTSRHEAYGGIHPKCLESLVSVLNGLRLLGKLKEAKEMLSEVNTVLGNLFAVDAVHPVVAKSLLVFGEFARDRGQYDASAAFIERAVSMYTNLYGDTDRNVATCLCSLADSVTCQGKLFEAKKINEQSLEIREVKITMTHADIAQSLAGLAGNYSDLGLYDKALLLYKKAFKIAKRSFGSMNNLLIANVVAGTGSVLTSMGYYTHAEQLHEVASTLRLQLLDRNHPLAATSRSHLSSIYLLQGLPDKAQSGHEEVLDIRRDGIGAVHKDVATSLNGIGLALLAKGQFTEARSQLERALNMRKKLLGTEHADVGDSLHSLGLVHYTIGKLEEAMVFYDRALSNRKLALGHRHPLVAETLVAMASIHNQQCEIQLAYDVLADSLKIRKAVFGEDSLVTAESYLGIAHNLNISGVYTTKKEEEEEEEEEKQRRLEEEKAGEGSGTLQESSPEFEFPLADEIKSFEDLCQLNIEEIDCRDVLVIRLATLFVKEAPKETNKSKLEKLKKKFAFDDGSVNDEADQAPVYEQIEKSHFISANHMYKKARKIRENWLQPEHPLVIEVMHATNVNNLMRGQVISCHEDACAVLFLRRKVHGERHPHVIASYVDLATSLRALSRFVEGKNFREQGGQPVADSMKTDGRKTGPSLTDQLKASYQTDYKNECDVYVHNGILYDRYASSTSAAIIAAAQPVVKEKPKKVDKTVPIGFMGYAYPERKNLFNEKERPKFGKLKVENAMWLLDAAENLFKESFGPKEESPLLAAILQEKGELLKSRRYSGEARKCLERCIDMRRRVLRNGHPAIADALHAVAETYRLDNEVKSAEPLYQTSLEIKLKEYGADHPSVADTLNSLAMLNFTKGQYATCKVYYDKALDLRKRLLPPSHPAIAQTLNSLAGVLQLDGDTSDAELMYRQALEIKKKSLGDRHPDYASALNNLGLLLKGKGHYSDAKILYEKAIEIQDSHYGPLHPDLAASYNNLAALHFALEEMQSARSLYTKSIEIKQKVLGIDHPSVAVAMNNLAGLLYTLKEFGESIELFNESLRIRRSIYGEFHPMVAESMNNLSVAQLTNGQDEESQINYDRSLEILIRCYSEIHPTVVAAKSRRQAALEALRPRSNNNVSSAFDPAKDPIFPSITM